MMIAALALAALALAEPASDVAGDARAGMSCRLYPVTEVPTNGQLPMVNRKVLRELTINLSVPLNSVTSQKEISVEDPTGILAGEPLTRFLRSTENGSYAAASAGNFFTFVPDEANPYVFRTYVMKVANPMPKEAPLPYLFGVCAAFQNDGAPAPATDRSGN